jgi:hypothetical protein
MLYAVEQAGATGATERKSPPTRFLTRYQIGRNGYSNLSGNKLWRQTVPSQFASSTDMGDFRVNSLLNNLGFRVFRSTL